MLTRNPSRLAAWLLLSPALLFVGAFFLLPVGGLLLESFRAGSSIGLQNYLNFFADEYNREIYWRTLWISLLVTLVSAVVCYPASYAVLKLDPRWRGLIVGLVILPLMTSPVARTYTWLVVLGREGIVNKGLVGSGLIDEPLRILFTEWAVFIGLLQLMMPLMLLSLVSAMENLPRDVVPAARSLGASEGQVFWRVIMPLTREGLVVGGTLVFTGCVTAYVTPALLGGPKVTMLATLLYQKAGVTVDYAAAAVISVIMLLTTLLVNSLLRGRSRKARAGDAAQPAQAGRAA